MELYGGTERARSPPRAVAGGRVKKLKYFAATHVVACAAAETRGVPYFRDLYAGHATRGPGCGQRELR